MTLRGTRRFRAYLIGAVAALLLAACGSTASDVTSAVEPEAADATPTEAASEESGDQPDAAPSADADTENVDAEVSAPTSSADAAAIPILSSDEAIANAEANIGSLQLTDDALDIEVLAVGDGSVTTVRDVVDGDRAVLLWFFAPH